VRGGDTVVAVGAVPPPSSGPAAAAGPGRPRRLPGGAGLLGGSLAPRWVLPERRGAGRAVDGGRNGAGRADALRSGGGSGADRSGRVHPVARHGGGRVGGPGRARAAPAPLAGTRRA